jgi:NAD(P)-dependent dehydrogenase (short-subunit alcohol dehydrogenase family)
MLSNNEKLIAVIGATGHQGGAVVRALQANGQFKVRALTRNPGKHRELAEEVVEADLDRPETLKAAFEGDTAFFWSPILGKRYRRDQAGNRGGTRCQGCGCQALCLVNAAKCRSDQRRQVPPSPLYRQAKVDRVVKEAGFANHTFDIALFFCQNLVGVLAPQKQAYGSLRPLTKPAFRPQPS